MSDTQDQNQNKSINQFLYPYSSYHGKVKPENLLFNANLQEFAHRVNYICNLETSGKIKSVDAYTEIKKLWKQLKISKESLQIDSDSSDEK